MALVTGAQYSVKQELTDRLMALRQEGLVDVKAEVDVNNHSSTHNLLLVLNNLLRIRDNGAKPKYII
jgi:hypothetical protein